jgi:uncharacterized membrane protein
MSIENPKPKTKKNHLRFHIQQAEQQPTYGSDWFALKAESFARFFGTPIFLIMQTAVVTVWIIINVLGYVSFDVYPFILLNLAFSLQAAYAAPLILLAQTRQADRDKVHIEADALHREDIANASAEREIHTAKQTEQLLELLKLNTELTKTTQVLSQKIENLTLELHAKLLAQK